MQSVIFDIHVHVQGYHLRELETAVLGLIKSNTTLQSISPVAQMVRVPNYISEGPGFNP